MRKLDRIQRQEKDSLREDGGAPSSESEQSAVGTAKVLKAFSTCQTMLTTKIKEVKTDISLICQDFHKLKDL